MIPQAMLPTMFWLYFVNAILLILHEIDSAYWKEWELFKLPGGIAGFLWLHIPIIGAILYGLIEVFKGTFVGIGFSFVICAGGIFAFSIHTYFLKKGKEEFKTPISVILLVALLLVSITQLVITILALIYLIQIS